jgi:hypothetical protein
MEGLQSFGGARGSGAFSLLIFLLSSTAFAHTTHHKRRRSRLESGGSGSLKRAWCTRAPLIDSWTKASSGERLERGRRHRSRVRRKSTPREARASAQAGTQPRCDKSSTGEHAVRATGANQMGLRNRPDFSVGLDNDSSGEPRS